MSSLCFQFSSFIPPDEAILTIGDSKKLRIWKPTIVRFGFEEVSFEIYDCPL